MDQNVRSLLRAASTSKSHTVILLARADRPSTNDDVYIVCAFTVPVTDEQHSSGNSLTEKSQIEAKDLKMPAAKLLLVIMFCVLHYALVERNLTVIVIELLTFSYNIIIILYLGS